MELIICPRCGGNQCEWSPSEVFCEDCLLHEVSTRELQHNRASKGLISLWDKKLRAENLGSEPETLGAYIEQIPSDPDNWNLKLDTEGNLKMNPTQKDDSKEIPVTVFDVMISEEARNGKTYWHNIGVAFPLTNGSKGLSLKLHMFPGLRVYVKESIRAVGAARATRENTLPEETPF